MRAIIFVFLIYHISVNAQNDKDTTNKPAWAENMPERLDAPDIELDFESDPSLDNEREDLGFDRASLFEDEESEEVADDSANNETELVDENSQDEENKKQAELEAIAIEKAEQDKLAEQKSQAEILEEQQNIARQKLIEQVKLDEEKRQAEEKANQTEEQNIDVAVDPEPITPTEVKDEPSDSLSGYNWKKTRNVLPSYPIPAIKNKIEGWVKVEITIDNSGNVIDSKIVESYRNLQVFNRAALKAVNRWKFVSPSDFGIEDNLTQTVKIDFQL